MILAHRHPCQKGNLHIYIYIYIYIYHRNAIGFSGEVRSTKYEVVVFVSFSLQHLLIFPKLIPLRYDQVLSGDIMQLTSLCFIGYQYIL